MEDMLPFFKVSIASHITEYISRVLLKRVIIISDIKYDGQFIINILKRLICELIYMYIIYKWQV